MMSDETNATSNETQAPAASTGDNTAPPAETPATTPAVTKVSAKSTKTAKANTAAPSVDAPASADAGYVNENGVRAVTFTPTGNGGYMATF